MRWVGCGSAGRAGRLLVGSGSLEAAQGGSGPIRPGARDPSRRSAALVLVLGQGARE